MATIISSINQSSISEIEPLGIMQIEKFIMGFNFKKLMKIENKTPAGYWEDERRRTRKSMEKLKLCRQAKTRGPNSLNF